MTEKVYSIDAETDPFLFERVPQPFIWGLYDGTTFKHFFDTKSLVDFIRSHKGIFYAHNGGKFDFMFLLPFLEGIVKTQVIGGRIVSVKMGKGELRDSYAAVPEALGKIQKDTIEYWKMEKEHRETHMPEIISYLKSDCVYLWELMVRYRGIAGKRKTIASNALSFAKKLGIDPGKSNYRFDKKLREYYYGGRCECFKVGTHKDFRVLDIHSAYPYAMMQDHPTGCDYHVQNDFRGLDTEQIKRSFIKILCHSKGAFPVRKIGHEGGLSFPHAHGEYNVTGWEYLTAKEFGLISDEKIMRVRYTNERINFRDYVTHWYEYKKNHPKKQHPIEYTIGKIMMNSLYGKLAQNPARYYDYKICPAATEVDSENGWQLYSEYDGHEIHRRESLWKWKYELGVQWEAKAIFNNVATGASITGFTRAHLLTAMCRLGMDRIIYCDTDGIVCHSDVDLGVLSMSDEIGDWELEDTSPIGHFAGKKLYGIKLSELDPKTGDNKIKIASKGSKLAYSDLERIIRGETVVWKNPAPTFSIDGSAKFMQRKIKATGKIVSPA